MTLLSRLRRSTRGRTTAVFPQHWTREAVKTYNICFVYHMSWWPCGADLGALLKTSRTPHSHFHTRSCSHTWSHFTITRQRGGDNLGILGQRASWAWAVSLVLSGWTHALKPGSVWGKAAWAHGPTHPTTNQGWWPAERVFHPSRQTLLLWCTWR